MAVWSTKPVTLEARRTWLLDRQGRGLGRMLLATLVERAEAQSKHVMVAGIEASNAAFVTLHRRAGFEEAGQLREVGRKFGRWLSLLFMQKILSGPTNPDG